jgi:hypothetical protein
VVVRFERSFADIFLLCALEWFPTPQQTGGAIYAREGACVEIRASDFISNTAEEVRELYK